MAPKEKQANTRKTMTQDKRRVELPTTSTQSLHSTNKKKGVGKGLSNIKHVHRKEP